MKDYSFFDFGQVLAFLLPGVVSFYSLSYVSPLVSHLWSSSLSNDSGIGVEFAILLFSLVAGVIIGGIRATVLDPLQVRFGVNQLPVDYSKLTDEHVLSAFQAAISNVYRFAQFNGNMFLGLAFLLVARSCDQPSKVIQGWPITALLVVCLIALWFAHKSNLEQTFEVLNQITDGGEFDGDEE